MNNPTDNPKWDHAHLREAYRAVRDWYQKHTEQVVLPNEGDQYRQASVPFVRALPPPSAMSELEIIAVFREVCLRHLEWAYGAGHGGPEMAKSVHDILEKLGRLGSLSNQELNELHSSPLWPFIKP